MPLFDHDVVEVHGMLVTSVARTVLDLASISSFMSAVVTADAALRTDPFGRFLPLATSDQLLAGYAQRMPFTGHVRAREVVNFSVAEAETPIESVSRVSMRIIGCPAPALQQAFFDGRGFIGRPDFTWLKHGAVGEADGDIKYLEAASRSGRAVEQVFLDEKIREDRLRALPQKVARWRWSVAVDPRALGRTLSAIGIPLGMARR